MYRFMVLFGFTIVSPIWRTANGDITQGFGTNSIGLKDDQVGPHFLQNPTSPSVCIQLWPGSASGPNTVCGPVVNDIRQKNGDIAGQQLKWDKMSQVAKEVEMPCSGLNKQYNYQPSYDYILPPPGYPSGYLTPQAMYPGPPLPHNEIMMSRPPQERTIVIPPFGVEPMRQDGPFQQLPNPSGRSPDCDDELHSAGRHRHRIPTRTSYPLWRLKYPQMLRSSQPKITEEQQQKSDCNEQDIMLAQLQNRVDLLENEGKMASRVTSPVQQNGAVKLEKNIPPPEDTKQPAVENKPLVDTTKGQ